MSSRIPKAAGWRIKLLYHIFDDFDRFAQDYGIDYWLEGGSVIGFWLCADIDRVRKEMRSVSRRKHLLARDIVRNSSRER